MRSEVRTVYLEGWALYAATLRCKPEEFFFFFFGIIMMQKHVLQNEYVSARSTLQKYWSEDTIMK
jgi:hypothetical protein